MVAMIAGQLPRRQHRNGSSVDMELYFTSYQSLLGFVFERVFIGETSTLVRPFRWTSLLPSVLLAMSITPKTTSDAPHNHKAGSRSPYRILPKTPCDGRDGGGVGKPDCQNEPMASHPNTPRLDPQNMQQTPGKIARERTQLRSISHRKQEVRGAVDDGGGSRA